jgi:hypothetical protein
VSHAAISNLGLSECCLPGTDRRVQAGHAAGKQEASQLGWRAFKVANWPGAEARRVRYSSCDAPGQLVPYGARPRGHTGREGVRDTRFVLNRWHRCSFRIVVVRAGRGIAPGPQGSGYETTDVPPTVSPLRSSAGPVLPVQVKLPDTCIG